MVLIDRFKRATAALAVSALFVSGIIVGAPAAMAAEANASISGWIMGTSTQIYVEVYDSAGEVVTGVSSELDGSYLVDGLLPGSYALYFAPTSSAIQSQWWKNKSDFESATKIALTAGQTKTEINPQLKMVNEPPPFEAASISGKVTLPGGAAIPELSIWVNLMGHGATRDEPSVPVEADGSYSLEGLDPGTYTVEFASSVPGVASQWWDNKTDFMEAKILTLTSGEVRTGINATLGPIASISSATPTITGTPKVGSVLTAATGTWTTGATLTYQWNAGGTPITGATAKTFTLVAAQVGKTVTVTVTGAKTGFATVAKTSAATTAVTAAAVTSPFKDIAGSAFKVEIEWMYTQGITTGYDAGNGKREYRPTGTVTRDAMAAFLFRAAGSPPSHVAPAVSPFVDVPKTHPFYKEITWLAASGISGGWDIGGGKKEYRPDLNITRDAMAVFLYRYAGKPAFTPPATSQFVDVPTNNVFYREIAWMASTGITTGYDIGGGKKEFRPFNPITRDAMAAFLYRFDKL